jgi:type IV secretory pathway VirB10-like protein
MRTSMAYFAGAGTVIAAIVGGVGGGLLIADMISPKSPKQGTELTRLERRMAPESISTATAPSEPVPYLAVSQPPATNPTVAAAPPAPQTEPAQPQTEAANSRSAREHQVEASTRPQEASPKQNVASAPQPAPAAAQPVTRTQAAASEDDARAKAKDADAKRVTEKRKAERRQQWAEKRRYQQRQDPEVRVVDEKIVEEAEPRRALEPVRVEMPLIRLFGAE